MARPGRDPYLTLGVSPGVSGDELRSAYRRLVQLHHPDHNGGSPESARRFEEVQEAYARIRELRSGAAGAGTQRGAAGARTQRAPGTGAGTQRSGAAGAGTQPGGRQQAGQPPPHPGADPDVESRLANLERELREANAARERARRAAREAAAAAAADRKRPSDEELGYVTTDDSFSKILSDARTELSERFSDAQEHPVARRVTDLIDELASKLRP
jgi:curved DNA-binding protein CbpA